MHRRSTILLIFLLSGAAGLVYEVVWTRQLVLVFGNTTQAVSTILTGFFGGMAIGSIVGGRVADRISRPLRLYGLLELVLALIALLTPLAFNAMHELYRGAFETLEGQPELLSLVRFGLALLALGPATILMGATLPTLSRYLVRDRRQLGTEFGSLYAVNTIGAIAGTLLAGFVLIELLGLTGTLAVGAACSAIAGVVGLVLSRRFGERAPGAGAPGAGPSAEVMAPATADPAGHAPPASEGERTPRPRLALVVAFVSGLTSLGYQTLWTRLLASGSGNTTYVFTTILATFLVGLAAGAVLYAVWLSRIRHPLTVLGIAQLALSALVIGGLAFATKGLLRTAPLPLEALLVVLPATLVMGIVFPMSATLVSSSDARVGTNAGLLLGANTIGAITATFVVPFILIPILTSPRVVLLLAVMNALTGMALLTQVFHARSPVRLGGIAAGAALTIAAAGLLATPNRLVIDPGERLVRAAGGQVIQTAEDEIAAVVSGKSAGGSLHLWVTGNSMTSITVDARLMPDLPLMLRPQARSMLIIAFGMGSSYRSALIDRLTIDGVELVPSVPEMFQAYYGDAAKVLANPNGHLIIADGRNHVELTSRSYDLVMVDPPPPIRSSGTAVLYSREFYAAAKARLAPNGVMMEWMPYDQSVDEFRAHVRTFRDVFPNVTLALGTRPHGVFMLGSDGPVTLTDQGIREVLARPGVTEDLSSAPDAPVKTADAWARLIPTLVWLQGDDVAKFGGSGPVITDDRPLTEYYQLRHLFGPPSPRMSDESLRAATP